jgi:hypothetical protein
MEERMIEVIVWGDGSRQIVQLVEGKSYAEQMNALLAEGRAKLRAEGKMHASWRIARGSEKARSIRAWREQQAHTQRQRVAT